MARRARLVVVCTTRGARPRRRRHDAEPADAGLHPRARGEASRPRLLDAADRRQPGRRLHLGPGGRPVAPHGDLPAEPGLPARRAHRDPVEELCALHHGRGGDLDGGLHDGRHFSDRNRRDDQLRADAQRGEPAVRRQARHLAAAATRRAAGAALRRVSARTEDHVRHVGRDRRAYRTNRGAPVAQCRRTGHADLHVGFDRNTEGRDGHVRGIHAHRRGHHGRRTAAGRCRQPHAVVPAARAQLRALVGRGRVAGRRRHALVLRGVARYFPAGPAAHAADAVPLGAATVAEVPAGRVCQDAAGQARPPASHSGFRQDRREKDSQGSWVSTRSSSPAAARRRSRRI